MTSQTPASKMFYGEQDARERLLTDLANAAGNKARMSIARMAFERRMQSLERDLAANGETVEAVE